MMATRRGFALVFAVLAASSFLSGRSFAQSCPAPLANAKRLVLVTAERMNDVAATMRLYERASNKEAWRALGDAEPALIGKAGMGWPAFCDPARQTRRADQGRRRQADAGGHFSDRPELRHPSGNRARIIFTSRPTRSASTIRRRRPTTPSRRAPGLDPTSAPRT